MAGLETPCPGLEALASAAVHGWLCGSLERCHLGSSPGMWSQSFCTWGSVMWVAVCVAVLLTRCGAD